VSLHLIKLCVGCDTIEELIAWRARSARPGEGWKMRTRQTPRRAAELIEGGSLYRVYRGHILSRQRILAVETVDEAGRRHCEVTLAEEVIRTLPTPRRAFQGWRYLPAADAPPDLSHGGMEEAMPPDLARRLRELGAW
jgi:hypothetical protein